MRSKPRIVSAWIKGEIDYNVKMINPKIILPKTWNQKLVKEKQSMATKS
jgi:hypothetical protein